MLAFKGHFDGHVIIPDGHVSLPRDRELSFQVETGLTLVSGRKLLNHFGRLDEQAAREISQAIERDCERIDDEW